MKLQIVQIDENGIKKIMNEMEAIVPIKPENDTTESLTIQVVADWKNRLERFAFYAKQYRALPKGAGLSGNISWSVNLAILYMFSNFEHFLKWYADFVEAAMKRASERD